jgi:hypothetical protein
LHTVALEDYMGLKHLELTEMAGLTRPWVGPQRSLLQAIPQVAPWLPALDAAHAHVVEAQPATDTEMANEVAAIVAEEQVVDVRHDNLARFVSLMIEADQCRCRAAQPPLVERDALCAQALKQLLPDGLLIVNALFVAEAGSAERTRALVASKAWLKDLLSSIPIADGTTLLSAVDSWCAQGERLGQLEQQRAAIEARIASVPQLPRAQIVAARNEWLKAVNMVLSILEMVKGHEQAIEELRAPVLRTADVAAKRYTRPESETPAPETPSAPAAPAVAPVEPVAPAAPGMPGAKPFVS